jgi:hypothetical protein
MYICSITWIGSSPLFSPFYLSPLFMMILTGLKIVYSSLYRKYFNHKKEWHYLKAILFSLFLVLNNK